MVALKAHLAALHLPERVVRACVWALRWEQVRDLEEVRRIALPDPFEIAAQRGAP